MDFHGFLANICISWKFIGFYVDFAKIFWISNNLMMHGFQDTLFFYGIKNRITRGLTVFIFYYQGSKLFDSGLVACCCGWTSVCSIAQNTSVQTSCWYARRYSPNVSTTPITEMGCRQCLPLSVVQLKGKHCQKTHCRNGVVDTFRL